MESGAKNSNNLPVVLLAVFTSVVVTWLTVRAAAAVNTNEMKPWCYLTLALSSTTVT